MLHLNGLFGGATTLVTVGGMALSKENLPLIRAKVGLVFQNPGDQLFSLPFLKMSLLDHGI